MNQAVAGKRTTTDEELSLESMNSKVEQAQKFGVRKELKAKS